mgnify:CR=1 FL=1
MFPTVADCIDRIRARDATIRAFAATRLDDAAAEARHLAAQPPKSKLHGVPFSVKDEWETLCLPTSGGSWRHRERRSTEDATVVRVLRDAGAVLLGKTNMSDLGVAPETTNHVVGATRNPSNLERTAGGSSGGSAAAVADGMSGFDWGADIGGSIRYPAALCGVYGMRLSSEAWPSSHSFPCPPPTMSWLLAHGPLARTLPQLRAVLETLAPAMQRETGRNAWKPTSIALHGPPGRTLWGDFAGEVGPRLSAVVGPVRGDHALPTTRAMQWTYNAVWASHFFDLLACDPTIGLADGIIASVLAVVSGGRLDKRVHPTTAALLLQIALGGVLVFRDKQRALADAHAVKASFERVWSEGTLVAMPVTCYPAPRIGHTVKNMRVIECTVPGNLADAAAIAIPFGKFADGLPRALQLMGPPGSELQLIELAERFEAP